MRHLDLFSGIGGFALAARWVGWETVGFCEIDPYCQKVLRKHWPDVPIYEDIRELDGRTMGHVDIITGGYPCQPFSSAGNQRGEADDRHLWPEFARLIREIRPRWAIGENVAGHINLGLDGVLADLEGIGYTTEQFVIPACAVNAPHRRDRIWILASYAECLRSTEQERKHKGAKKSKRSGKNRLDAGEVVADSICLRELQSQGREQDKRGRTGNSSQNVADAKCGIKPFGRNIARMGRISELDTESPGTQWATEPNVGRVADGIPRELDLYRGLIFEQEHDQEKDAETLRQLRGRLLRAMWEYREIAKTSPDLYRERLRDCLPEVSYEDSHGGWYLGAWIEESQGLCNLWEAFYSKPLEEAQNLQQELLERVRKIERSKEVGPTKDRVKRLMGLGNSIVPQVAEVIFRAIERVQTGLTQ